MRVRPTGKLGYGYGYELLYPPPSKRAQEHSKRMRNGQDIAKTSILAYLGHSLSVLDVLGLVLSGKTRGLRVGVRTGRGTGKAWRTRGLPGLFTTNAH